MSNKETTPKRIVITGGGIGGLAAAHALVERITREWQNVEVVLLEAGARLGGIIKTEQRDGFLLEAGPDAFISEKPEAVNLARRIGLEEHLIATNEEHRRSFIVRGNRLRSVPEGFRLLAPSQFWSFAKSDVFSPLGKARIALDLLLPRRGGRVDENEAARGSDDVDEDFDTNLDESLADFVRRRFGREALERMAQPMVAGIYTADPELLSLRATMPRFLEMEQQRRSVILSLWQARRRELKAAQQQYAEANTEAQHNAHRNNTNRNPATSGVSGARYNLFLSFDGGMQMLVDALAARLPSGTVRFNTEVAKLAFDATRNRWRIETRDTKNANGMSEIIEADEVCLALPSHRTARLLKDIDAELAGELAAIPYASTATINFAYRRDSIKHPLDGFGFVVPFVERRATLACTFASVKFKGRAPAGHVLLRAFVGGALQPEMFEMDDERMIAAVEADFRQLLGAQDKPLFASVTRWHASMAQYHIGHIARVRRIRTRLAQHPTLHLAGNFLDGAGIPDCIRHGERAAKEMIDAER